MKSYITEFIGSFFWVLVLGLSVSAEYPHLTAISLGAVVMGMMYMGYHISGAHYNPAITVAAWIRGNISWQAGGIYLAVQILGAIAAAALTGILVQDESFLYLVGKAGSASAIQAVLVELLFTFLIVLVYLNVCTGKTAIGNSFYGLAVGGVLAGAYYVGGDISGGAYNPAVGLAPNVLLAHFDSIWIYLAGPFLGGILAGLVYRFQHGILVIKKPETKPASEVGGSEEVTPETA